MLGAGLLPLMAVVSIAVPKFEVDDGVPAFVGERAATFYAESLATCATVQPSTDVLTTAVRDCFGQSSCLAGLGRGLHADRIVLGNVRRAGPIYQVHMLLFDVEARRVTTSVTDSMQKLGDLSRAAIRAKDELCKTFAPAEGEDQAPMELALPLLEGVEDPSAIALIPQDSGLPPPEADATTSPDELALLELPPIPEPEDEISLPAVKAEAPAEAPRVASKSKPTLPKAATRPVKPEPPKPFPWHLAAWAGAGGAAIVGAVCGALSSSIMSADKTSMQNGVLRHSVTRAQAERANGYATAANVFYGVAAVGALGGGYLYYKAEF